MTALAIPDPRKNPIPLGWAEREAAPAILAEDDWEQLDEYEARLRAVASYVESFSGDAVEFEKALRVVEKRRGDLLGATQQGHRSDLEPLPSVLEVDESEMTQSRWRTIAANWDEVWPLIRDATRKSQVTQAAVLRAIGDGPTAPVVEMPTHLQLLAEYVSLMARVQGLLNEAYEVLRRAVVNGATKAELIEVGGLDELEAERFLQQKGAA